MRSLRVCFAALSAATLLAAGAATAADLRIGVVNMERILRESKTAIEASDRLNAEGQRRQEEIEGISRRFKARLERFEKDAPSMTESERVQERRSLAEMERDVTRRSREAREEFNQRRNEEVLLLQNRAGRVVQDLAKKEQFDLVLYEFFYASDRVDLTSRVIEALDRDITAGKTAKK
ncbi:OmpH family outer membrane protein [uncultured Sutterella sp.]|uniref:OmpH family outer membrane protein n=1 Tax=uncultured Sutterella sp. TaxID=286133 RepID=UPI00261FA5D5|nr:OmpH family outer membrane protein [uncultured Sutterella sp.]